MNSPPLQALKIYILGLPQRERHLFAEKMGHISSTTWIPIPSVPLITLSAVPCESNASTMQSTLAKIGSLANIWHSLNISYKEYVYLYFINEILIFVFTLPLTIMNCKNVSCDCILYTIVVGRTATLRPKLFFVIFWGNNA